MEEEEKFSRTTFLFCPLLTKMYRHQTQQPEHILSFTHQFSFLILLTAQSIGDIRSPALTKGGNPWCFTHFLCSGFSTGRSSRASL